MHQVKLTYKVLAEKELQRVTFDSWKDWALEMILAGYETEHLLILAGLYPTVNRFQLDDIIYKTLQELSLHTLTNEEVIYGYVYYLIDQTLQGQLPINEVLYTLKDLYLNTKSDQELYDLGVLADVQEELIALGVQFDWKDANGDDIDTLIHNEFIKWKKKCEAILIQ